MMQMYALGTKLVLKNTKTGEVRNGVINDYPGDASVVFVEVIGPEISAVCEVDDGFDPRPLQVGWHLSGTYDEIWEIMEIEGKVLND
jgi:hypothetical protein